MLQGAVVDDAPSSTHHFTNPQSGDTLSAAAYHWDPTNSQTALASPSLASNQNQQQSLIPIPLAGDTRTNNSLSNATTQNTFGTSLNSGMAVLGSSLNSSMVGALINPNPLAPNVPSVAPSLSPPTSELPQRSTFSIGEGSSHTGKSLKKARGNVNRKPIVNRVRNRDLMYTVRGPNTSPVSTTTLPNVKQQPSLLESSPSTGPRQMPGGKLKGRGRGRGRGMDSDVERPGTICSNSPYGVPSPLKGDDPCPGTTSATIPSNNMPQQVAFPNVKNIASTENTWQVKKSSSRARSRRKTGDGTNSKPVPVHLRNPKKGRARVFRECKQCRSENHIRRSDCSECRAPLPAGKRKRDGNPSYERKRQTTNVVPSSDVVSQPVGSVRPGVKEDIAVSSVISK